MKKSILLFSVVLVSFFGYSQIDSGILGIDNWLENWTNFKPIDQEYKKTNKSIIGLITDDTTLSNRYTYLLQGVVYVTDNATLTIEPGTIIRGDHESNGTLVVTKGAKIIAEGTALNPIVFTSNKKRSARKPGDWGGIIILGDAPVNTFGGVSSIGFDLESRFSTYGGDNIQSSSGILKYIRIEYSGGKLSSAKELNAISFAGVGDKTIIENVQVSYSNDNSFEFIGGNLKMNNLISYRAIGNDFDFTKGTQSIINNSIAIRNPYSSGVKTSRSIEIDTYDKIENFDPSKDKTIVKANNITLVNVEDNEQGLVKEAINLKKDSYLILNNSVVYGFRDFVVVDDVLIIEEFEEVIALNNVRISHCKNDFSTNFKDEIMDLDIKYNYILNRVKITDDKIEDFFINPDLKYSPDFRHISFENDMKNIVGN
ncbi:hypothetical protein [uncultured Lacinutrix sp.]|uniref:hypothetical protein n=1 Tax=uncultured Lacinutrix sp. TaxID=574032 RepID=UPI00260D7275|nr:hypothetical protein [uncultured Lacinutrix sp.]